MPNDQEYRQQAEINFANAWSSRECGSYEAASSYFKAATDEMKKISTKTTQDWETLAEYFHARASNYVSWYESEYNLTRYAVTKSTPKKMNWQEVIDCYDCAIHARLQPQDADLIEVAKLYRERGDTVNNQWQQSINDQEKRLNIIEDQIASKGRPYNEKAIEKLVKLTDTVCKLHSDIKSLEYLKREQYIKSIDSEIEILKRINPETYDLRNVEDYHKLQEGNKRLRDLYAGRARQLTVQAIASYKDAIDTSFKKLPGTDYYKQESQVMKYIVTKLDNVEKEAQEAVKQQIAISKETPVQRLANDSPLNTSKRKHEAIETTPDPTNIEKPRATL